MYCCEVRAVAAELGSTLSRLGSFDEAVKEKARQQALVQGIARGSQSPDGGRTLMASRRLTHRRRAPRRLAAISDASEQHISGDSGETPATCGPRECPPAPRHASCTHLPSKVPDSRALAFACLSPAGLLLSSARPAHARIPGSGESRWSGNERRPLPAPAQLCKRVGYPPSPSRVWPCQPRSLTAPAEACGN